MSKEPPRSLPLQVVVGEIGVSERTDPRGKKSLASNCRGAASLECFTGAPFLLHMTDALLSGEMWDKGFEADRHLVISHRPLAENVMNRLTAQQRAEVEHIWHLCQQEGTSLHFPTHHGSVAFQVDTLGKSVCVK